MKALMGNEIMGRLKINVYTAFGIAIIASFASDFEI